MHCSKHLKRGEVAVVRAARLKVAVGHVAEQRQLKSQAAAVAQQKQEAMAGKHTPAAACAAKGLLGCCMTFFFALVLLHVLPYIAVTEQTLFYLAANLRCYQ